MEAATFLSPSVEKFYTSRLAIVEKTIKRKDLIFGLLPKVLQVNQSKTKITAFCWPNDLLALPSPIYIKYLHLPHQLYFRIGYLENIV